MVAKSEISETHKAPLIRARRWSLLPRASSLFISSLSLFDPDFDRDMVKQS